MTVMIGDVLTFARAQTIEVVEIAGLGERRGPANEARTLYIDRRNEPDDGETHV